MKKKTKVILWSIVLAVILIEGMIEGGKYYMDRKEEQQQEMMIAFVKKYRVLVECQGQYKNVGLWHIMCE